jgi:hypothetical protein
MTSEFMMSSFLGFAHSGWRWLVLITAVVALLWAVLRLLGSADNARLTRLSMAFFTISMDVQVLLGILHFVERATQNGLYDGLWIHFVVGILALGALHSLTARARRQQGVAQARTHLIAVVASFGIVFLGVAALVGGLPRWF